MCYNDPILKRKSFLGILAKNIQNLFTNSTFVIQWQRHLHLEKLGVDFNLFVLYIYTLYQEQSKTKHTNIRSMVTFASLIAHWCGVLENKHTMLITQQVFWLLSSPTFEHFLEMFKKCNLQNVLYFTASTLNITISKKSLCLKKYLALSTIYTEMRSKMHIPSNGYNMKNVIYT